MDWQEEQIQKDENNFSREIERWASGERASAMLPIHVAQTSLALQCAGMEDLPIYIDVSKLALIKNEHPEITPEVLKQIPRALTDPIMIIKSATADGRIIAALDLRDAAGVNIVVPFALNVERNEGRVNMIASVYGKGRNGEINYGWYVKNMIDGNLLYAHTKKTTSFLAPAGVQFPMAARKGSLFNYSIKTEEDLVKLKMEREAEAAALKAVCAETVAEDKKSLSPAERSFLAEKEALLAQRKKWNPAYTVRTAKKLAEQGFGEKEIAAALQKHAPDIQNLPNTDLRQNAAARIAKSAAGSVRVGQQEQNKEKSR